MSSSHYSVNCYSSAVQASGAILLPEQTAILKVVTVGKALAVERERSSNYRIISVMKNRIIWQNVHE
jgi:hypothetical protein